MNISELEFKQLLANMADKFEEDGIIVERVEDEEEE